MSLVKHTLPKLNYKYEELEPFIDALTVELHHSKHHQAYVDGLNKAEEGLAKARETGDFSNVKHLKREIAFHGSGHILHSLYWSNMTSASKAKGKPSGGLLSAIEGKFGSFETFVKEFKAATAAVEGSGWGLLVLVDGHLEILTIEKHQNLVEVGAVPLLTCDVWEHAYYLKYQNKRPAYIDGWFNLINWEDVEERYLKAVKN
jgi:Fe-Mn family superoxide dismutase